MASWWPVVVAWLNATCDSPNTRRAYRRHLRLALGPAGMGLASLGELSGALLTGWRARALSRTQVEGDCWSDASLRQHLAALRSFLRWADEVGASPVSWHDVELALRVPRGRAEPASYSSLSEPELARLLTSVEGERDRALLGLMAALGLRRAEVCALDCSDLQHGPQGPVLRVRGKGRRERLLPLYRAPGEPTEVHDLLTAYLAVTGRQGRPSGPLFLGRDGRLGEARVRSLVVESARRAGLGHLTAHGLRHTAAERMLRASGDLHAVQRMLGHASPVTTQRYLTRIGLDSVALAVPPLPGAGG